MSKNPLRNVGLAVAKIVGGRADVAKCAEVIAKGLADAGDVTGAATVREAIAKPTAIHGVRLSGLSSTALEWPGPVGSAFVTNSEANGVAIDRLLAELQAVSLFVQRGIDAPTRLLFAGPSGTGKTTAARWMAEQLGLPLAVVRLDRVVSMHLGETATNLAKAIADSATVPSVLFLDEIDGLCTSRTNTNDLPEMQRVTSSLLQQIDMLPPQQILICATNHAEKLDGALLRRLPSRVDFDLPDRKARLTLLAVWWELMPHDESARNLLLTRTDGVSGAVLRDQAMAIARRALLTSGRITAELVGTGLEGTGGSA